MRRTSPVTVVVVSLTFVCSVLSSCALSGLAFEQDHRIEFIEPRYREKIQLPFTLRWSLKDFEMTGPDGRSLDDAGYIELLFDREPQPPGEGLDYFARDDITCLRSERCPNRHYLAQRGIFTTTKTYFVVRQLPPAPGVDLERGQPDIHSVVLVLLDGQGRRIGETAWWNAFEILHDDG